MNNPFDGLDNISAEAPVTPEAPASPTPAASPSIRIGQPPVQPWQPTATTPQASAQPTKSRMPKGLIIGSVVALVIIGLLGAGYFAYAKGYVAVPFLPVVPDQIVKKSVASAIQFKQAQYTFLVKAKTEARDPKIKAIPLNTNSTNTPIDNFGFGDLYTTPSDVNVTGSMSFYYEFDKTFKEANAFLKLDGGDANDHKNDLALELRKVGFDIYGQVTKLPAAISAFIPSDGFVNTWIHLASEKEVDDLIANNNDLKNVNVDTLSLQKELDRMKRVMDVAAKTKVFTSIKRVGTENIGTAKTTHYSFAIDSTKMEPFIQGLIDDFRKHGESTTELDQALKDIHSDSSNQIKSFLDATTFGVWIDSSTGIVRQADIVAVAEYPSNKQIRLNMTMTLDKLNERVTVDKPTNAVELKDFESSFTNASLNSQNSNTNTNSDPLSSLLGTDAIGVCYLSKHHEALSLYPAFLQKDYEGYTTTTQPDSLCQGITEAQLNQVGADMAIDQDKDGLNKFLESVFKSSDSKTDTDGDGFSDVEEIQNGYNPNGDGKLIDALLQL